MDRRLFAVTLALLALAAVAILLRLSPANSPAAKAGETPEPHLRLRRPPGGQRPLATPQRTAATPPHSDHPAAPPDCSRRPPAARSGPAAATKTSRTRQSNPNLARRAEIVEQQANHELQRLIELLDLPPQQHERVFKALVRSSAYFAPGLTVGGTTLADTGGTPEAAVLAELTDAQAEEYLQDTDERSAWWEEFLTGVAGELAGATPAIAGSGVASVSSNTEAPAAAEPLPEKDSRDGFVEE